MCQAFATRQQRRILGIVEGMEMREQDAFSERAIASLELRVPLLRAQWQAARPFPYLVIEDFLPHSDAERVMESYPSIDADKWAHSTYSHQRKKFTLREGFPEPVGHFFDFAASPRFLQIVSEITGIPSLLSDPELVGGGLHQIVNGGFLDVHVDFNFHPTTHLHRRLNLLVYMNKQWKPEYEGRLEFWDMREKRQVASISPDFNRAVIFETSEISYHGHPVPLASPPDVTRKSLATYYYTREPPGGGAASEHNTIYEQTTGARGYVKTLSSSLEAVKERASSGGALSLLKHMARKVSRRLRGLPPANG
jgi:Rps23 Pro-64 3,4-dihydroxylase Tpa1-like proline 4-hydroxylase